MYNYQVKDFRQRKVTTNTTKGKTNGRVRTHITGAVYTATKGRKLFRELPQGPCAPFSSTNYTKHLILYNFLFGKKKKRCFTSYPHKKIQAPQTVFAPYKILVLCNLRLIKNSALLKRKREKLDKDTILSEKLQMFIKSLTFPFTYAMIGTATMWFTSHNPHTTGEKVGCFSLGIVHQKTEPVKCFDRLDFFSQTLCNTSGNARGGKGKLSLLPIAP